MAQVRSRPDLIDGKAMKALVEARALKGATILGQPGGWAVVIRYGALERTIAAQRSRRMRLWRKLDTAAAFVHEELGLSRFEVDAEAHDATVNNVTRPDQSERLRRQQEAADYDAWFRAEVEAALREADDPATVWVSHEEVEAEWRERRARLQQEIADENSRS